MTMRTSLWLSAIAILTLPTRAADTQRASEQDRFSLLKLSRVRFLEGVERREAKAPPAQQEVSVSEDEKRNWPKTVDEAVARILSTLSEEDRRHVKETPKEKLIRFHHGWGMSIRNSFGLWRGNAALLADAKKGHPDGASMVIIEAVWSRLQTGPNKSPQHNAGSGPAISDGAPPPQPASSSEETARAQPPRG
jgi:hypothetical protein